MITRAMSDHRARRIAALAAVLACGSIGCGPPMHPARISAAEPPSARERAAADRFLHRRCSPNWKFLYPGLGQICLGKPDEGAILATLATTEAGALISGVAGHQATTINLTTLALQNVVIYSLVDPALERQRAKRLRFVPQDTLAELVVAPFNVRVLGEPYVWGSIVGLTAVGVTTSVLLLSRGHTFSPGGRPVLYGHDVDPAAGYPIAAATFAGLYSHVSIGEEILYRGYLQSSLARHCGEGCGWAAASLFFGVSHAPNAFALAPDQRLRYLGIGLPLITLGGQVLGLSYRWSRYSLAAPVAIHFWYDFLLSAIGFAADPRSSPLSAKVGFPF